MEKFKNKYRIGSCRLKGYDYATEGYYFVTICSNDRVCCFGEIVNYEMRLSEVGKIVEKYWNEIPKHFENVILDEFVIMPNHIHGIIVIENDDVIDQNIVTGRNAINRVSTGGITGIYNPMGKRTLGEIIRWYKGRCTFEIRKQKQFFAGWQSNYYEHIIRDEKGLVNIRKYK